MGKRICVYCSSSNDIPEMYFESAITLGKLIATRNHTLIYGGGLRGLMGVLSKTVHQNGGKVIGIVPKILDCDDLIYRECDELIITEHIRLRKMQMDEMSDGFIALPGGFGTLEEILEIITIKQIGYHNKPVVILNVHNYFDYLLKQFEKIFSEKFAQKFVGKVGEINNKELYFVTEDPKKAIDYIESY